MDNVRTIYLDWNTGGIVRSDSGAYLARQYDHLSNLIVFRNAPGLENYYLIVEMKEGEDDLAARSMEPIMLPGPYWLVPNVYTQLVQPVTFQVCCKTESGDFEQHSAKFKLNVIESLRHDGADLDVDPSPMFDAYEDYVDEKVQSMIVAAGDVVIDPTLSVSGAAADAKAAGDAIKAGKTFVVQVPGSAAVYSGSITAGDFAKALAAYTAGSGVYAVKDSEVYQLSAVSSSTMTFTQMYHGTMNFIKQIQITSADTFTVTNTSLSSSAADTSYSNTASGLTATNVQDAIDESAAALSNTNERLALQNGVIDAQLMYTKEITLESGGYNDSDGVTKKVLANRIRNAETVTLVPEVKILIPEGFEAYVYCFDKGMTKIGNSNGWVKRITIDALPTGTFYINFIIRDAFSTGATLTGFVEYVSERLSVTAYGNEANVYEFAPLSYAANYYPVNPLYEVKINANGIPVHAASYYSSDYIEIPQKYGKNMTYIHVLNGNAYGGSITIYDENKALISTITSVTAYIENVDTAKYVRVSFGASVAKPGLFFTNESTMPTYSYPKMYLIQNNDLFGFEKNVVSDGCMTEMVKTALAYAVTTTYGYGTEHTAFGEECIKTTKDTHTASSNYEGERYQIDCSTYLQLIMMGIKPACSRYFYSKNVPAPWGFVFNSLVAYEGYVYGVKQTANTKRLYANSIAEYAYKNGYLFTVEDGFRNIKPGDIIFTSNQNESYNFFENIGHCAFVYNVTPLENGNNSVETFEAHGTNTPCSMYTYTTKDANKVYAARFPFNFVSGTAADMAVFNSPVSATITTEAGSAVDVCTINLSKALVRGNVYTAVIDSEYDANGYFTLAVTGAAYMGYRTADVLKRPDGRTVIRFVLYNHLNLSAPNEIKLKYVSSVSEERTVNINGFKLYDGFVTV